MRYIFVLLIFFFPQMAQAWEMPRFKMSHGRMWVQMYDLNGRAVFNDDERDEIIASCVEAGTGTIGMNDFIPVVVSTHIQQIVRDMNDTGNIVSPSMLERIIERKMSKDYCNEKTAELELKLLIFNTMALKGYSVATEQEKHKLKVDELRGRMNVK